MVETSSGVKPSVGQLVSVIVRAHLQGLNAAANVLESADESLVLKASPQQMIEEQIRTLR